MSVIKMTDLDLAGKRVFIRADLNVVASDDARFYEIKNFRHVT